MDADQETQTAQDAPRAHLEELLESHRSNLADLELQASHLGLVVPLELSNGIRYEKQQIRLYTDALDSPLSDRALERIGPGGRTQIMVKRVDRLEAQLSAREAFDQLAREQRQREIDARDAADRAAREQRQREVDARDARRERLLWGIAVSTAAIAVLLLLIFVFLIARTARG